MQQTCSLEIQVKLNLSQKSQVREALKIERKKFTLFGVGWREVKTQSVKDFTLFFVSFLKTSLGV